MNKKWLVVILLTIALVITAFVQLQQGRAYEGPARHAPAGIVTD